MEGSQPRADYYQQSQYSARLFVLSRGSRPEPMTVRFSEKLRHLRLLRRFSQTNLAHHLGLASHTHLSHLEAGRKAPSLDLVVRLAAALGTSLDYLLRDEIAVAPAVVLPTSAVAARNTTVQLPSQLHRLRIAAELTQADLAERIGVASNAHISLLEAGKKEPSLDLVLRLANFFSVSLDYLVLGEGHSLSGADG